MMVALLTVENRKINETQPGVNDLANRKSTRNKRRVIVGKEKVSVAPVHILLCVLLLAAKPAVSQLLLILFITPQ